MGPSQLVGISLLAGPMLCNAVDVESTRPTSFHIESSPWPFLHLPWRPCSLKHAGPSTRCWQRRVMCQALSTVVFTNSVKAVPMDVGWVHNQEQDKRVEQEDVGAVTMNTVCHGCGGCGYLKWECPTLQRNEKANREGGCTRGGDKGKGKGYKGAGKVKGTCCKCGKQGHKAADCKTRVNMVDEQEDEDECEMQPVGGVWTIGQISQQPVRGHRDRRRGQDTSDGGRARRQDERECDRSQRRGSEEAFGISREDGYGWKLLKRHQASGAP